MTLTTKARPKKVLSVFSLAMINVIAVDSLRTLPISAEYGLSVIFYYSLAAILFFIPIALATAELATGWPTTGGIYIWAREAFGKKIGFLVIWLQWVYNIFWYPTIMAFIASTIAYLINPALAQNKLYLTIMTLVLFWTATIINCFGMKVSSFISEIGAIVGTLLPMIFIIGLAIVWLYQGKHAEIHFHKHALFPSLTNLNNIVLFVGIIFGLMGLEMSAVHAGEVQHPKKDYPRALLYSSIIVYITLLLGSLSIATVVPQKHLSLVTGLIDAFSRFFTAFHLTWMIPVIACLMVLGSLSGVAAWVIGPTKGLLVASRDGTLPKMMSYTNKQGVPVVILMIQAIIVSILSILFIVLPTINSSYWLLTALSAQLALLVYAMMFASLIRLRHKEPHTQRHYKIPGGKLGAWLVGGIGFITCLLTILVGFFPPSQFPTGNIYIYETILITGMILFCGLPIIYVSFKKHH